jgi:hypothetical protein
LAILPFERGFIGFFALAFLSMPIPAQVERQ